MSPQPRSATDYRFRKQLERERAAHIAEHGPGCQICGTVPKTRGLQWDHDHKTGKTRGWLCHRCNRNLPTWVTSAWLWNALLYLDDETLDAGAIVLYAREQAGA